MEDDERPGDGFLGVRMSNGVAMGDAAAVIGCDERMACDVDSTAESSTPVIVCCLCGESMLSNPSATCEACQRSQVDPSAGLPSTATLLRCRQCLRWQTPRQDWIACDWESKQLLALCLSRLRASLAALDAQVIGSNLLYTEPHSKRVKLRLLLQKEVSLGVYVEKDFNVEFTVVNLQCDKCKRAFTPHTWNSLVQVRQKVHHKRSLMYLEQLILKSDIHNSMISVAEVPNGGLDFRFEKLSAAKDFGAFVASHLPVRSSESSQMISQDFKNNTCNMKHTIMCEVAPICKDDLVFLPPEAARKVYGGCSSFLLCQRVTSRISLIDPFTLRGLDVTAEKFFRWPFASILNRRHLVEFVVLNVESVDMRGISTAAHAARHLNTAKKGNKSNGKHTASIYGKSILDGRLAAAARHASKSQLDAYMEHQKVGCPSGPSHGVIFSDPRLAEDGEQTPLVDVEIARLVDFGQNDNRSIVRTHLGRTQIRIGDYVLGYDLRTVNFAGLDEDSGILDKIAADVILVRKAKRVGGRTLKRNWALRRLRVERAPGATKTNADEDIDLEEFRQDLEEDEYMRTNVNFYKSHNDTTEDTEADVIKAHQLLERLNLEGEIYQ